MIGRPSLDVATACIITTFVVAVHGVLRWDAEARRVTPIRRDRDHHAGACPKVWLAK